MTRIKQAHYVALFGLLLALSAPTRSAAQVVLSPLDDIVLATDALLMPRSAIYGRAINGLGFQTEAMLTQGGYQYATWYRARGTSNEDVMLSRRDLATGVIEVFDTGRDLVNGDSSGGEGSSAWDAHNVIALGVSAGDGRIHLSYDHHGSQLNYTPSINGAATGAAWDASFLSPERAALNAGGPSVNGITYPRFISSPDGGLVMTYRTGGSGNGNVFIASYDDQTGLWNTPHQFINGTNPIPYTDPVNTSNNRNAYLNGLDYDSQGNIHVTWTWREEATGGSNHDINYASSSDGGNTWRNSAGAVIGTVGSPIDLNSPGIAVVPMNRTNTLMNQQTQTVDADGRVHAVMWHKRDGLPPQTSPAFTSTPSAYYHYFRDPTTGDWARTELPTERAVGSRPDVAYDALGNLYVSYVSPGPGDGQGVLDYYTEGDLIVASATKAAGFTDWKIVHTDTRDFSGEPRVDHTRLLRDGVVSIFLQENSDANTGRTATPLHVLEFTYSASLTWAGDSSNVWDTTTHTPWDTQGIGAGNARFYDGYDVVFDDSATSHSVRIDAAVSPGKTIFRNTAAQEFNLSGAAIAGAGGLLVEGGGRVLLANGANAYTGETRVQSGELALAAGATVASSSSIRIDAGARLDATAAGGMSLAGQSARVDGELAGDVQVLSGATLSGAGRVAGAVTALAGVVRVGQQGIPQFLPTETLLDDFSSPGLGAYTQTKVLDQAGTDGGASNVSFSAPAGVLRAGKTAGTEPEQVFLLRDDHPLTVGQEVRVSAVITDVASQDIGLMVSATAIPASLGNPEVGDTREDFLSIYLRTGDTQVLSRGKEGLVDVNLESVTVAAGVDDLFIARTAANTFELGYYVGDQRSIVSTRTVGNASIGGALGFFTDMRGPGLISGLDNLRVFDPGPGAVGETLTIDGDVSLALGATLELDLFSPAAHDRLVVGGALNAGGGLVLTLDPAAPALAAGDSFDLFDFASLAGVFDSVTLPLLGPGLLWDNSQLLAAGVLSVASGLPGDYNRDGFIDASDYTVFRDTLGMAGAGLAADGNADLRVDDADYQLWRAAFAGAALSGVAASSVPEPRGVCIALMIITAGAVAYRRRCPQTVLSLVRA